MLPTVAALSLMLGACSLLPGASNDARTELQRSVGVHAARWADAGIESYTFTITRSCFCPPEASGPFEVTVTSGQVVDVTMAGRPVDARNLGGVPLTIDAVFASLAALDVGATVTATWDPTWGFPTSASVDPIPNAIDDEFSVTIEDFSPTD